MRLRIIVVLSVFFNCYSDHLDLHSFPTRRSSDLILVTAFLLGLDPRAVVMTGVLQFFMTLFPHWNVRTPKWVGYFIRSEEHTSELQSQFHLVCRLLLEKKKYNNFYIVISNTIWL